MSWLSRLLGGNKPHTPRSQLHRLGWPELGDANSVESQAVWTDEAGPMKRPTVLESPEEAAEAERMSKRSSRPGKPAQRGRGKRKRK